MSKPRYETNKWEAVYVSPGEGVTSDSEPLLRLEVPGGWIIQKFSSMGFGICFYPDPDHAWQPPEKT